MNKHTLHLAGATLLALSVAACGGDNDEPVPAVPTLAGFASLPADTYVDGPTSGQFITGGDLTNATANYGYTLPFANKQPMQGFSALANAFAGGCWYVMQDNGFGAKATSPDALLHVYAMKPDWASGKVQAANFTTCETLAGFNGDSYIRLRDPDRKLSYPIVADGANYPGTSVSPAGRTIPVDPLIKSGKLLTGGDLDVESFVIDASGNLWFGDEFGPFLVKTDRTGKVLQKEVPLPNTFKLGTNPLVQSPSNPTLGAAAANLPNSGGFESMTINPAGTRIYTMLEQAMTTDTDPQRRILNVFDIVANAYLPTAYAYKVGTGTYVNAAGATVKEVFTVNDMTAINDHEFLVIEKDRGAGDARTGNYKADGADRVAARVKKVYKIDLNKVGADGYLVKEEVADLMNIADPKGLGGAATINGVFTFPMESVEAVRIVDRHTIMIVNDSNYPGGTGGRSTKRPDNAEFILVRLPVGLNLP
jgi:hypothetical protein